MTSTTQFIVPPFDNIFYVVEQSDNNIYTVRETFVFYDCPDTDSAVKATILELLGKLYTHGRYYWDGSTDLVEINGSYYFDNCSISALHLDEATENSPDGPWKVCSNQDWLLIQPNLLIEEFYILPSLD